MVEQSADETRKKSSDLEKLTSQHQILGEGFKEKNIRLEQLHENEMGLIPTTSTKFTEEYITKSHHDECDEQLHQRYGKVARETHAHYKTVNDGYSSFKQTRKMSLFHRIRKMLRFPETKKKEKHIVEKRRSSYPEGKLNLSSHENLFSISTTQFYSMRRSSLPI